MRIKNWEQFQHYKTGKNSRKMEWVKVYRTLLDDYEWHVLGPSYAKTLINLWLIASESNGDLPSVTTLSFRLRMPEKELRDHIIQLKHWLRYDPSEVLGKSKGNTRLEEDIEEEEINSCRANATGLLDLLNAKTGSRYQPVPANMKLITARLNEYPNDDLRRMVESKCKEWGNDERMKKFLRPATLFNATKCAQYVGELDKKPKGIPFV